MDYMINPELSYIASNTSFGTVIFENNQVIHINEKMKTYFPSVNLSKDTFGEIFNCAKSKQGIRCLSDQCMSCIIYRNLKQVTEAFETVAVVPLTFEYNHNGEVVNKHFHTTYIPVRMDGSNQVLITFKADEDIGQFEGEALDFGLEELLLKRSFKRLIHELKQPISNIYLGNSMIKEISKRTKDDSEDVEDIFEISENIMRNLESVKELIDDLAPAHL